jgi:hypothetical protein
MKDLIRQILREYTEPKVSIREISSNSPLLKKMLLEQDNNIIFYDENNNIVNIGNVKTELIKYFKSKYNHPKSSPDGFCGEFNNKGSCKKKFTLNELDGITPHFVERIYRLSHPDYQIGGIHYNPNIMNPGKFEGLDFFFDNIDSLMLKIDTTNTDYDWAQRSNKKFYMFTNKDIDFSIIIQIYKNKPVYEVKFISQLKGVSNWKTDELRNSISVNVD